MFDRSLLPPADLEFVVLADTHYMADPGANGVEFASRRKQGARAELALKMIARLDPAFVVHLGDVAQIPIDAPDFPAVVRAAHEQMERHGIRPYHVAGNQDIGDKPDPTMPTDPVTPEALAAFHARFGRSWHAWQAGDLRCAAVNTQIMNTGLPEEDEQRRWLEEELTAHHGERLCLFLHLPLYLHDETEPHLGHYDNLGQPARRWLIGLIRQHRLELVCAGHSHFFFHDHIGPTAYYVTPSTSHTRPGFSESFASGPPNEQGRDDAAKLGFFLARQQGPGLRLHFIRTNGRTEPPAESPWREIVTRLSPDLPASPLGLTLRHPLAPVADVPLAWPSVIRQRVRNDYPLLACLELGARHLRAPAADLADPIQARRLALLRAEGIGVTAVWLWSSDDDLTAWLDRHRHEIDTLEVQAPGALAPGAGGLTEITRCRNHYSLSISLAPIIAREWVAGKQLPRARIGYRLEELTELSARLNDAGATIDRALCRVEARQSPWEAMTQTRSACVPSIGAIDWAIELAGDDTEQAARTAEALAAATTTPGTRLFLEPLLDLDRTMDRVPGLLDRQCNPRPIHTLVRCLNTILFANGAGGRLGRRREHAGVHLLEIASRESVVWLLPTPRDSHAAAIIQAARTADDEPAPLRVYDLLAGTSLETRAGSFDERWRPVGPVLLLAPGDARLSEADAAELGWHDNGL